MGLVLLRYFKNNKVYIWLSVIFLLGLAIRLYNPTFRSLWGDEAHSFFNAYNQISYSTSILNLIKDAHLPVYFLLLSCWIKLFGVSEYALRHLSIIIGIICLPAFYVFAREFFEEKTALFCTFLLSIAPMAIMHSQEIRMYGLMLLFSIVSSLFFWRMLAGNKGKLNSVGYVVFTVLLALTHVYAVLVIVGQFIFLFIDFFREKARSRFLFVLAMQLLAGVLILPLYVQILMVNISAVFSSAADMAFAVFPWYLKFFLVFFVLSLGETVAPWSLAIALPAGLIFGYLFLRSFRWAGDKKILFLLFMCLFPVIVSTVFLKPTMPKYLIFSLPFYLLLVGHSLMLVKWKALRYLLIAGIIIVQLVSIINYFGMKQYHNSNQIEPWRKVARTIGDNFLKGDIIIATNRFIVYRLLQYYLNIQGVGEHPITVLQDDAYNPISADSVAGLGNRRIWYVTQIADDRAFPPGYVEAVKGRISARHKLVRDEKFVPYEETLVSKLPIQRHKPGSSRIRVSLYVK